MNDQDRKRVVNFWYWIADKQLRNPKHKDHKELYNKLLLCKEAYNKYYPEFRNKSCLGLPFQELLDYVERRLFKDNSFNDLNYDFIRGSIHRVIIRLDEKCFKMWVKRQ